MNCVKESKEYSSVFLKSRQLLASLDELLPNDENIKKPIEMVEYWINTINSNNIIPLIGNKSTGKTSILNSFIGNELLPLGIMPTTKAFLIGHHNNNTIIISKANLVHNKLFSYFKEGIERKEFNSQDEAKNYLKDINSLKSSFEDSFYYIYVNLKRLLEIGISEDNLQKILFLDLPGLDMEGDNDNKPIFTFDSLSNLFNIVDSFLFINENNIDDNATEKLKTKLKDQILLRRKTFNIPINHSLFVLNQYNNEEKNEETFKQVKQKIERELNSDIAKVVKYCPKIFNNNFKEYESKDKLSLEQILRENLSEMNKQTSSPSPKNIKLKAALKYLLNKPSFLCCLNNHLKNKVVYSSVGSNNEDKINESDRQVLNSFLEENKIEHKNEEDIENECLKLYSKLKISKKGTVISPFNEMFFKELNTIIVSLNSEKENAIKTQSFESINKIQMIIEYIENIHNTRIKQDQERISTSRERINHFFTIFDNQVNAEFKKYRHLIEKGFIIESSTKEELNEYLKQLNNSIKDLVQENISRLDVQITKHLEKLYQNINNEMNKYSLSVQNEPQNQLTDTIPQFDNSVYDTLTSKSHLVIHGCWGGVHVGGAVIAGVGLSLALPVSLAILGGGLLVHGIIALVATIKDLVSYTKTVQKHLEQYKNEVLQNFDIFKETSMNSLKEFSDLLKEQIDRKFRQFDESKKFISQEQLKKFERIKKDFTNYKTKNTK